MERSSKLADLTLVSKYYPIANYSYPRHGSVVPYRSTPSTERDRSSLGSEGSAPGLIDDRTDSEASFDEDSQYHAHTAELWDTFWQPGMDAKHREQGPANPRKQYPALIPSPQRRRRQPEQYGHRLSPSWPLPNTPLQNLQRRPAATYSPFPKPAALPARARPPSPSWESSRPSTPKPPRPPRPDIRLLTPCVHPSSPTVTAFRPASERPATPYRREPASPREDESHPHLAQRPATSLGHSQETSLVRGNSTSALSESCLDGVVPAQQRQFAAQRMAKASCPSLRPDSEPHSVFEYDDDEDEEESDFASYRRSFFRFHKRSDSDPRRSTKASTESMAFTKPGTLRRRKRANTSPSHSDRRHQQDELRPPEHHDGLITRRKRSGGADVLGWMLSLRAR